MLARNETESLDRRAWFWPICTFPPRIREVHSLLASARYKTCSRVYRISHGCGAGLTTAATGSATGNEACSVRPLTSWKVGEVETVPKQGW